MNAKTCKKLRRAARNSTLQEESLYLINQRTGVIRHGRCADGLYRLMKKRWRTPNHGMPEKSAAAPGQEKPIVD